MYNPFMIDLIKKRIMNLILVVMLLWTVINVFVMSQLAAAGIFCAVVCPTVNVVMGRKYGTAAAVVGVVWLVTSIVMKVV